jgi:hypothetical protein
MSDLRRLRKAIGHVIEILESAAGTSAHYWATKLATIKEQLADRSSSARALEELEGCFGGMGSLNDYVFHPLNQNLPPGEDPDQLNARLGHLLDNVFRELRLVGASSWTRLHRRWLEFVNRKRLPPRVLKAFSRGGAA